MPGEYTFASGSRLLVPVSDSLKMPIDQVNFVFCLFVSLPISLLYYNLLSHGKVSRAVRLAVPFLFGVTILLFCFGLATKHVVADTVINYLIMKYAPKDAVHKLVFLFSMSYLSFIHVYRVYFTGGEQYVMDITGPMMLVTQKTTSLAFSLHDGVVKKDEDLSETQKREQVSELPSVLEYLSYVYQFQCILCGPLCFFSDYIAFIDGQHIQTRINAENPKLIENKYFLHPSPKNVILEKLLVSVFFMFLAMYGSPLWPVDAVTGSEALRDANYFWRITYVVIAMFFARAQYYFAWVLADAVNNAAGFGFNGYDEDGHARWDLLSNVKIWQVETAVSFRGALAGWNCTTMAWLRRVAYDRAPQGRRTLSTYLLSAWWHGFFPGYYITFLSGALMTLAGRAVRRSCRHYFLDSNGKKLFYDCLTLMGQKLAIGYVAFPFVLLKFWPAIEIYKNLYFSLHIGALFAVVLLPKILPPKVAVSKKED